MVMRNIFPTMIDVTNEAVTSDELDALQSALDEMRVSETANRPPKVRSQRFGTRVYLERAFIDGPVMAPLVARLRERATELTKALRGSRPQSITVERAWADWVPDGGFHHIHAHEGASWACVLTIDAADCQGENGALLLVDPRGAAYVASEPGFGKRFPPASLEAVSGRLVMFPAWLQHYVPYYHGTRERLAMALNLRL